MVLNMVATLDGKAALDGTTRGLGGDTDRELFRHLRTQADAIMAGAGTVREERYGRAVKDEALQDKRRDEGLAPEPVTVIVSAQHGPARRPAAPPGRGCARDRGDRGRG